MFTALGSQLDSAMATAIATMICGSWPSEVATVRLKEKPALAATFAHRIVEAGSRGVVSPTVCGERWEPPSA